MVLFKKFYYIVANCSLTKIVYVVYVYAFKYIFIFSVLNTHIYFCLTTSKNYIENSEMSIRTPEIGCERIQLLPIKIQYCPPLSVLYNSTYLNWYPYMYQ